MKDDEELRREKGEGSKKETTILSYKEDEEN
jgi:hypothetical protein